METPPHMMAQKTAMGVSYSYVTAVMGLTTWPRNASPRTSSHVTTARTTTIRRERKVIKTDFQGDARLIPQILPSLIQTNSHPQQHSQPYLHPPRSIPPDQPRDNTSYFSIWHRGECTQRIIFSRHVTLVYPREREMG